MIHSHKRYTVDIDNNNNNNFPFETKMGIIKTKYVYLIGAIP